MDLMGRRIREGDRKQPGEDGNRKAREFCDGSHKRILLQPSAFGLWASDRQPGRNSKMGLLPDWRLHIQNDRDQLVGPSSRQPVLFQFRLTDIPLLAVGQVHIDRRPFKLRTTFEHNDVSPCRQIRQSEIPIWFRTA